MSKKKSINTTHITPVEVYKLVLNGKLKIFPAYFWDKPDALSASAEITQYLVREILCYDDELIKQKFTNNTFKEYKLYGMIAQLFKNSCYAAINNAFPDKFKPWEIKCPSNYWNLDTAKVAIKWLIEEKLQWNEDMILLNYCTQVLLENNLRGLLIVCNNSPFVALENAYPSRFDFSKFQHMPKVLWHEKQWKDEKNREKYLNWLIVEVLKIDVTDLITEHKISQKDFIDNGLYGLLQYFCNSPYKAVISIYPNCNWCMERIWKKTKTLLKTK